MDYFLIQDVKADEYKHQLNDCRADNSNLMRGIEEKQNQLIIKDTLISAANQKFNVKNDELTIEKQTTKTLTKSIKRIKFALYSTIGGFVTYITYNATKPP
jgi:low affinity Fe/Cu permease